MRTEFISLFAELNAKELDLLTREVKETVDNENEMAVKESKTIFTAANLWNIHNMRNARVPRRNSFS